MIKNFFIPSIGTEIELVKPWTFMLFKEYRNTGMFRYLDVPSNKDTDSIEVTLPSEAILKIDRIYIRKGQKGFDSVTFRMIDAYGKKLKPQVRFWVKLQDANMIVFDYNPNMISSL